MTQNYIIAEIGINHNGDMNLAKELIDNAKLSGCDAVKLQKRTINRVYTAEELDTPRDSPWGTTNRQQKEGLEFSMDQIKELEAYAGIHNLDFIISCWDIQSIDDIEKHCNVTYHKVASALATDKQFLQKLNETGKPVILSTGMCTQKEIDAAIDILDNVEYVLACTSTYPTKPSEVNLLHILTLKKKYPNVKIGFSNHYNGVLACYGAAALGSECIEFHITKDRTMYGSDQPASIENPNIIVDGVRVIESMLGTGLKVVYESEKPIAEKLRNINDIC
tara:strand:- start:1895 stop:2728 length:834 start_codon:yes stop_codon:yes gene_type:complete